MKPSTSRYRWLELALWAIGSICLGLAMALVAEGLIYQLLGRWQLSAAQSSTGRLDLATSAEVSQEGNPSRPDSTLRVAGDGAGLSPPQRAVGEVLASGTPLGTISISAAGVDAVILEGIGEDVLRRGVGHFPPTSMPGGGGNIALAAHRDTFFRGLRHVEPGQRVLISTADGRQWAYRVEETEVVEPTQVDVLDEIGREVLTLITCYPFRYVGPAPQRFVVRAYPEGVPPVPVAEPI